MVQAENGTVVLRGDSGRTYNVDFYASDVVGAACTFNPNGAAISGSLTFYKLPESATIIDLSIATGLTATTGVVLKMDDGIVPGRAYRLANYLNTINSRPPIGLRMPAGTNFGMLQT